MVAELIFLAAMILIGIFLIPWQGKMDQAHEKAVYVEYEKVRSRANDLEKRVRALAEKVEELKANPR